MRATLRNRAIDKTTELATHVMANDESAATLGALMAGTVIGIYEPRLIKGEALLRQALLHLMPDSPLAKEIRQHFAELSPVKASA